jgi:hypothetical protein
MKADDRKIFLERVRVLEASKDPDALEEAAIGLAASRDPEQLQRLGDFLTDAGFLARLDDLESPEFKRIRLSRVMKSVAAHPIPEVTGLCARLANDPTFLSDDDRMADLLPTLAAVWPTSAEGVAVFKQANAQGYFAKNALLLASNGSPLAMQLFEEMIADRKVRAGRRIDLLHHTVVGHRTAEPMLASVERLLAAGLEPDVLAALVESVFDYQDKKWFGPARDAPRPVRWDGASDQALNHVLRIATKVRAGMGIPPALLATVDRTARQIEAILARRRR